MRVLVIEDTADLADAIRAFLARAGHAADHAPDIEGARAAMAVTAYDAVVLDLGLPDGSGLSLLQGLRRAGDRVPVIIATARDQISDRIAGLDAGADDYVVKPFDLSELEARLRAHARRSDGNPAGLMQIGDLAIDRARARVTRDGAEIRLTAREWAILDAFLGAGGRVMTRVMLEERLFDFDAEISGNAVEVYISRLRTKLGREIIETRRGLGYVLGEAGA